MSAPDMPRSVRVTYHEQYRRCGKPACARCADHGPGHGPYWYAFWRDGGRTHSRYLGKQAPVTAASTDAAPRSAVRLRRAALLPPLRVQTLGAFAVWRGTEAIPPAAWTNRRAATLFKCLLAAPGHHLRREEAGDLLWPNSNSDAGDVNLRTTIYRLRRALDVTACQQSYLRTEDGALILAPGDGASPDGAWLDATAFAHAARAALASHDCALCRAVLERYTGEYLPDDPYAEWAAAPREALRRQYLDLLLHLAALSGAQGDLAEAEECLRRVLAAEPDHEAAAATLMTLLAESSRRPAALRVYQDLSAALGELGLAPGAEVATLRARLLAHAPSNGIVSAARP